MTVAEAKSLAVLVAAALALTACGTVDRIRSIGQVPPLSPIMPQQTQVVMPMPPLETRKPAVASLWQPGSRSFFRDPRAAKIGDILTVNISIGDEAKLANTTTRTAQASESSDLAKFLGLESQLSHVLPDQVDPAALSSLGSDSTHTGAGTVDRSEDIRLVIAAVVSQVLPNGNLVITGRQEVRVNNEVRELSITGVVRPEDIASDNTIRHTQIAEARISYGGHGQIMDVQQPRYGQQLYNILWPF
jgi:flagellar L-ring protein precursor FlgH